MKEEILNKFIEKSLAYLSSAEAFLGKEVPSYIQELLTFKFYESLVFLGFGLFFIVITVLTLKYVWKLTEDKHGDARDVPRFFIGIFGTLGIVLVTFIGLMDSSVTLIKIKTAPRVYLVEYFKGKW